MLNESHSPLSRVLSFVFEQNAGIHVMGYGDEGTFADLWLKGLACDAPEIAGQSLHWNEGSEIALIVGADAPSAVFGNIPACLVEVNFSDHLTAASWAVAWRLRFPDARARIVIVAATDVCVTPKAKQPEPSPGIQVLWFALLSKASRLLTLLRRAFSRDRVAQSSCSSLGPAKASIPWISTVNSTAQALCTLFGAREEHGNPLVPGISGFASPSLAEIVVVLGSSNNREDELSPTARFMLRNTIWESVTSDRERHHAVSNVIGALLLGAQVGNHRDELGAQANAGKPGPQDCLLALVQACGVTASSNTERGKSQCWTNAALQTAIGAAVLIDDMADIWGCFLRGALGFVGDSEFPGTGRTFRESFVTAERDKFPEDIQGLPSRLKAFLVAGDSFLTAEVLVPGTHRVQEDFVLFLDLRLFPKRGTPGGDRQDDFLKQLAEFGLALLDSNRGLPWLDDAGRKCLREELDHLAAATPAADPTSLGLGLPPAETLLPRLLSLLDPTLPIVIFSSTHGTDLIDPFRNCGNIITAFRKPTLGGMTQDWSETVKELRIEFATALGQATGILRARHAIHGLHQRVQPQAPIGLPPSNNGYLVELFFDESAEPSSKHPPRAICTGGIVVVRSLDANDRPIVSDSAIFEKLAATGCIWGWCSDTPAIFRRPVNTALQRKFMPKGTDLDYHPGGQGFNLLEKMVGDVRGALGATGSVIPFAVIDKRVNAYQDWMEWPRGINKLDAEEIMDATLRGLVQHAIEGLLFRSQVFRKALAHPNTRVAIDLGIRDYPCDKIPRDGISTLLATFGIEVWKVQEDGMRRWSINPEDGYIITSETIARTGRPWPFKARIARARAVALQDFGKFVSRSDKPLPKQLHYLADAIAHIALFHPEVTTGTSGTITRFFASGWIADFREQAKFHKDIQSEKRFAASRAWDQNDCVRAVIEAVRLTEKSPQNGVGIDLYHELVQGTQRLSGADFSTLFRIL